MLDCVPIAQPLARRRDGGLVRSTSNSSAGARANRRRTRSYIALDLSHLLSGGIVECATDCALRLAYVEVEASPRSLSGRAPAQRLGPRPFLDAQAAPTEE
jgi:hypothetical protein